MPNWCTNYVRLRPNTVENGEKLIEGLKAEKMFQTLCPMPEEYNNTTSPNGDPELSRKLTEKYGYADWYDWCVGNWGTKWDACELFYDIDGDEITVSFDTAWSPPTDLYDKLVAEGWQVYATYHESGMGYVGEYSDGFDECYDYSNMSADEVEETIPDYLDEEYNISNDMREWEDDENEVD